MQSSPTADVDKTLIRFLRNTPTLRSPFSILIAFSGGLDSSVLLTAFARLAQHHPIELHAAHIDHRLDQDSARRARRACEWAAARQIPCRMEALEPAMRSSGESLEDFARRQRYRTLTEIADRMKIGFIATAHHADDQAETVLLRMLFGSGIEGLTGIAPQRRRLLRPFIDLPRQTLRAYARALDLDWVEDPTNRDSKLPRNAIRHFLLPRLRQEEGTTTASLCRLAKAARAARRKIEARLDLALVPQNLRDQPGIMIERQRLESLPAELRSHALAFLHRRVGRFYPPSRAAQKELWRQWSSGTRIGCDCGDSWRWESHGSRLLLLQEQPQTSDFAYTVEMPGQVEVPELDLNIRLELGKTEDWMFHRHSDRAGLAIDATLVGGRAMATIRNRCPGDRLVPLGRRSQSKLKDLLSKRRIPQRKRGRLPLLIIDGEIAWVPGVAIAERFKIREDSALILKIYID